MKSVKKSVIAGKLAAVCAAVLLFSGLSYASVQKLEVPAENPKVQYSQRACSMIKWQLFYFYLDPAQNEKLKEYGLYCGAGRTSVEMPGWIKDSLPALSARQVWRNEDGITMSERDLWQAFAALQYEFLKTGGEVLSNGAIDLSKTVDLRDCLLRYEMAMDRLFRSKLGSGLEGRGAVVMSDANRILEAMDRTVDAVDGNDYAAALSALDDVASSGAQCFGRLFEPATSDLTPYSYTAKARIVPGYRGVSLLLPSSQILFAKPGDRADLLVTFNAVMSGGKKELITATILQNVVITRVHFTKGEPVGMVELLLNPNEAQYTALSANLPSSDIMLSLRAKGDVAMRPMEIASFRKLYTDDSKDKKEAVEKAGAKKQSAPGKKAVKKASGK